MTEQERSRWCHRIHGEVFEALPFLSGTAVNLAVAHLALESGYGAARAAQRGHNLGNITAGPYWLGDKWVDVGGDTNGQGARITQTWRIYSSVAEFLIDYWRFLGPAANSGRYVLARNALERGELAQFSALLYRAGYFELAPDEYTRRLAAVSSRVIALLASLAVPPAAPTGP